MSQSSTWCGCLSSRRGTRTKLATRFRESSSPLFDRRQNVRHYFSLRLRADVAFTMQSNRNVARLHVARTNHEHRVHFRFLGALNLAVDLIGAEVAFGANHVRAEFGN